MKMFADDARGILDGRGIVGKGGHAGAEHAMQIMKWRMGELANGGGGPKYLAKQSDGMCLTAKTVVPRNLKDFLRFRAKLYPSVDFPFRRVTPERSVGLSVSGAVAPSAPARRDKREPVSSAWVL